MTYKNLFLSLLMIIVVGVATWTTFLFYPSQNITLIPTVTSPDAYMEEVTATIMDIYGKPSMKIVTPKMLHFADNDTTELTSPELTLYRKASAPWYITAKFAEATQGIDQVDFWDDVTIHRPAHQHQPATLIKTTTLVVYPNKKMAETKDNITLIQPNLVVKAKGMQADMNTGDIRLLSQTQGEYVPDAK